MSTVLGQITDPIDSINSTWHINIQNENKIIESDNITTVSELNVDESKDSNIQLPLKFTVLQNADSTVMDHYNANQNIYDLNTYTEPTSTTSQLDQQLIISTNNSNKNQTDQYYENNQKINYSKSNLDNYNGFSYSENQYNEETFQNQSFVNNSYLIEQSSQNQNTNIISNENNEINKNVYETNKQPTKNTNYCNSHQDRLINNRHYKNTDRSSKFLRPHSTPATLVWLEENYETADGVCIPRSTLYMHYVDFCSKNFIQPVNAASFGKIIRQQFPQLTTRRLGTRGQSRYHYYGIAVKENSIYHQQAYSKKNSSLNSSLTGVSKESEINKGKNFYLKSNENSQIPGQQDVTNCTSNVQQSNNLQNHQIYSFENLQQQNSQINLSKNSVDYNDQNSSYLNNSSLNGHHGLTINLPEFPNVKKLRLRCKSAHFSNKHLLSLYSTFLMMYRTHCQRILDTLVRCNLTELNTFTNYFWQAVPEHLKCVLSEPVFHCLIAICDCILYKCMAQILSAPLFQSNLPENLVKIINKFSDQLEWNTKSAMNKLPEALKSVKLALSRKSACLLRRQSLLSKYINETKTAINSDFNTRKLLVLELKKIDVSLIFNDSVIKLDEYQIRIITTALNEFEILLEDSNINDWLNWINSLLNKCVSYPNQKLTFVYCAKKFYKIWNLISTCILKQLSQIISPFYGVFYSIRNLFNEYILYSLEFLHFDERIKEFTLNLYQDYCPNIKEPFFEDFETNEFNLKQNLYLKNNFNYDQNIKVEKNENNSENYNSKNLVYSDKGYDTQLYSACSSSYYSSDYYQQQSANNYHNCQVSQLQNNLSTNGNYQQTNDPINHFHQLNNYCNNSNLNPNHHHLHHHLHHQTYHLFINNSSNNPNFTLQNYNSNEQQNENYQLNYINMQNQQNNDTEFLTTDSNFNNVSYEQLSPIENQINPEIKNQTNLFYQSNTY